MDRELLDSEQIVAIGDASRDSTRVGLCTPLSHAFVGMKRAANLRCRGHVEVEPLKVGPKSLILNQTVPEPSNAAAVVGALAM